MSTRFQLRRDTAANWAATNPVLASGELGYDTTNGVVKFGDGATAWNTLSAFTLGSLIAPGAVKSSSASAGIGYATGAGGTVVQTTSKSTGVTINKVCGKITTHSQQLNPGAQVQFRVTNSCLAIGDVVFLSIGSSGFPQFYTATAVYADGLGSGGSFDVVLRNFDSSDHSDSVVIYFAIIKGVTS